MIKQKSLRVILLSALVIGFSSQAQFNCQRFTQDLQNDEAALSEVTQSLASEGATFDLPCLSIMVQNNLFNTTNYLINNFYFANFQNQEIHDSIIEGVKSVRVYFDNTLERLKQAKRKPILMRPPFQWAQNLHQIQIEVKYAYRHDVSGCGTLQNESVVANETHIHISAFCQEQDNFLQFEVNFEFWDKINETSLKWDYEPVGKHYISFDKLNKPARWRQLYKEGTTKPPMMKLWFEKHQKHHYQLYEFENDDIEDFEGHDLIDVPGEQDHNDMSWLFPARGPGEFKKLADKKKKKKSGKNKKKKTSSKM